MWISDIRRSIFSAKHTWFSTRLSFCALLISSCTQMKCEHNGDVLILAQGWGGLVHGGNYSGGCICCSVWRCNKFIMREREKILTPSRESKEKWQLPATALSSGRRKSVLHVLDSLCCVWWGTSRMNLVRTTASFHILLSSVWALSRHLSTDSNLSGRSGELCESILRLIVT